MLEAEDINNLYFEYANQNIEMPKSYFDKINENEMIKEENSSDYIKLEELQKKIDELNKIMEEKMIEWNSLIS